MRVLAPCLVACLVPSLAAQIGYTTGFEGPTFTASAAGTGCAGQDGFYIPAVAGSIDASIYTYAGNALGIPANPSGGANFYAGRALTSSPARSQRLISLPTNCRVLIEFDVLCTYAGVAAAPPNNIGSFSFQPSASAFYVNLLARWPTGVTNPPATWNADFVDGAGAQVAVPDPAFQNLATNVWHRWGCVADLATREYVSFRITDGTTGVTTVYTPAPGTLPLPLAATGTFPTDFRLFTGGADDVFAVDNLVIDYAAEYTAYGSGGCSGSLGVPTLVAAPGSRPTLGSAFQVVVGNLPLNAAILITGFSNTTALGGAFALPLNLVVFGFPGCNLLADPVSSIFLVGAGNAASWTLNIPNNTSYLGIVFFNQGFSLDTSPALAVTDGRKACIGR